MKKYHRCDSPGPLQTEAETVGDQTEDYQIEEPRMHESEEETMQNPNRNDELVEQNMTDQNPVLVQTYAEVRPKRQRPPKRYEDCGMYYHVKIMRYQCNECHILNCVDMSVYNVMMRISFLPKGGMSW